MDHNLTDKKGDYPHLFSSIFLYARSTPFLTLLALYLISLVLYYPAFLPNLGDINPFDEAAYLQSGYMLLNGGGLAGFAGNPFTQLFYALMALPFKNSVFWMVHACSLGRLVLFTILWIGFYQVGRALSDRIQPLVLPIMLVISPVIPDFLRFPSDPLYAGFSALALAKTLLFLKSHRRSDIGWASFFLGIAALSRNDGVLLFLVFITLALIWAITRRKLRDTILPAAAPFLLLVGGYIFTYGLFTGNFSFGTMQRTYDNFETGHGVISQNTSGLPATPAAKIAARDVYGTPEENNYSVFNAIRKRPDLYLARVKIVLAQLPRALLDSFGLRVTAVLILMAVWGVISLLQEKDWSRLLLLALWPAPFVSGFIITIFRTGHIQFYAYVFFALAGIGLFRILQTMDLKGTQWSLLAGLSLIALYGFLDNKLAVAYGGYIFLTAFSLIVFLKQKSLSFTVTNALLILLIAMIITRGSFPSPAIRILGERPEEKIVLHINQEMENVHTFAAASQGVIHAAGKHCVMLTSHDVPTNNSPEDFLEWLQVQGIEAVYVDKFLTSRSPAMWAQIEPLIGTGLTRVFNVDQGSYQILLVQQP